MTLMFMIPCFPDIHVADEHRYSKLLPAPERSVYVRYIITSVAKGDYIRGLP